MGYLILHGWQGSGPDHWQTWLAERLRADGHEVRYPDLPDPDEPRLDAWLAALDRERGDDDTVICHSLACVLWLHHRDRGGPAAPRVLLVAPPCLDPAPNQPFADFFPVRRDPVVGESCRLVCSDDDPFCASAAGVYGSRLGCPIDLWPGAGHINPDAGFGPWPAVLDWCYGAKKGVET